MPKDDDGLKIKEVSIKKFERKLCRYIEEHRRVEVSICLVPEAYSVSLSDGDDGSDEVTYHIVEDGRIISARATWGYVSDVVSAVSPDAIVAMVGSALRLKDGTLRLTLDDCKLVSVGADIG
jgi:hypothetical protein